LYNICMTATETTIPTPAELRAARPSDPSKISFAPDCFVEVGRSEPYWLVQRAGWAGGMQETSNPRDIDLARAGGRLVEGPFTRPVQARIKWR
jgi:hypothetical protein